MAIKAADIDFGSGQGGSKRGPEVSERIFRERGEQRYSLELLPAGITIEVDRLRRERHELVGELMVTVTNGHFPAAKTVGGVITVGDFNFSSVQARSTRAKLIAERAGVEYLDWFGFLEEFCVKTIAADRMGHPAIVLADAELEPETASEVWDVSGWPVLRDLPMVLFGDAGSGKSYWALWVAGNLAIKGIPVLYADWEFSQAEHRKRLGELFNPMPKGVLYARCDTPLSYQVDRLSKLIREHGCKYLICDSIGFAVDGPAEAQESARTYFKALRQLGVGSLNLAHIPKQYDDSREAQIFGSTFFKAGARSAWFVERATENPTNELRFGMHHRKSNVGQLLAARGFKLCFERGRVRIESVDVKSVDELAAQLPLLDRMKRHLAKGNLTIKAIAEDLNASAASVRSVLSRHKSQFVKLGNKYGLLAEGMEF